MGGANSMLLLGLDARILLEWNISHSVVAMTVTVGGWKLLKTRFYWQDKQEVERLRPRGGLPWLRRNNGFFIGRFSLSPGLWFIPMVTTPSLVPGPSLTLVGGRRLTVLASLTLQTGYSAVAVPQSQWVHSSKTLLAASHTVR